MATAAAAHGAAFVYGVVLARPRAFLDLVERLGVRVVLHCERGVGVLRRQRVHVYVALAAAPIATASRSPLPLPSGVEVVEVEDVVLPPAADMKLGKLVE